MMGIRTSTGREDLAENWYWYLTGENKDGFSSQYELNGEVVPADVWPVSRRAALY